MNLKLKVISACILLSMSVSATQVLAAASTNETTYLVNRGDPQLKVNGKYIDQIIAEVMAKIICRVYPWRLFRRLIFRAQRDTVWQRLPMMSLLPPKPCGELALSRKLYCSRSNATGRAR